MFNDVNSMQEAMEQLEKADDNQAFLLAVDHVREFMKEIGMSSQCIATLERRAFYLQNEYSAKDTNMRMLDAKKRVKDYITEIMNEKNRDGLLIDILENYYLFLENFLERVPHKKGGIQKEHLENLKIKNEYDVQHLLYAYLKPIYPTARTEVNEDTGYSTVRTDIFLDTDQVIEVKCTRSEMSLKKLVEEIEADMVHYSAKNIYFFIYDKAKIIKDSLVFKRTYEEKVENKQIHIIIHQPKIL